MRRWLLLGYAVSKDGLKPKDRHIWGIDKTKLGEGWTEVEMEDILKMPEDERAQIVRKALPRYVSKRYVGMV